ncbi:MAG: heterocyst-inhibiting protein PatX [Chroococcales cyanobacterium]
MRSYFSIIFCSLFLLGLAANFSGRESHSLELSRSEFDTQVLSARLESGQEIAPHRGSGR